MCTSLLVAGACVVTCGVGLLALVIGAAFGTGGAGAGAAMLDPIVEFVFCERNESTSILFTLVIIIILVLAPLDSEV